MAAGEKRRGTTWDSRWAKSLSCGIVGTARERYNLFFYRIIKPYLRKGCIFLEAGCGTAGIFPLISPEVELYVGLDISEKALSIAQGKIKGSGYRNGRLVRGDCFRMPFRDESFDVVWSQGVIQALDRPLDCMREQYRVCRKGGVVIQTVPWKYSYLRLLRLVSKIPFLSALWPWADDRFYGKGELLELAGKVSRKAEAFVPNPVMGVVFLIMRK
jgi:ubiquinone/menaquinone biosynthesis C-methylase UbiE